MPMKMPAESSLPNTTVTRFSLMLRTHTVAVQQRVWQIPNSRFDCSIPSKPCHATNQQTQCMLPIGLYSEPLCGKLPAMCKHVAIALQCPIQHDIEVHSAPSALQNVNSVKSYAVPTAWAAEALNGTGAYTRKCGTRTIVITWLETATCVSILSILVSLYLTWEASKTQAHKT